MNELEKRRALFHRVFTTPEGKQVLEMLRKDHQEVAMFSKDPLVMAYNTAQFELVQYLRDMSNGDDND